MTSAATSTGDDKPWTVRPYAPGDEDRVPDLFREVFHKPMTPAHYRWKLVDTPLRIEAPTAWLAETKGRIVGQYAGTPMRFQLEGEGVQALHGCDVMTAPDMRGRGVLTELGTTAREAWAEAGITLVTGLHYGGWGTRRHLLGWREQFRFLNVWCPLRLDRVVGQRVRVPRLGRRVLAALGMAWLRRRTRTPEPEAPDLTVTPVSRPGPEFDSLWDRVGREYESLVVRDRAWVTYRYAEAPHADYRILLARRSDKPVGYIVLRILEDGDHISSLMVDLFTAPDDDEARAKLVHTAFTSLEEAGAQAVRTYVAAGTPLADELRRFGFVRRKGHFDVSIIELDGARDYAALSDPERWFVMPGDFDVW